MGLPARLPEPRLAVIEGRPTLVVQRRPPLPPTLEQLRRSMAIAWQTRVTIQGARAACVSEQDHRLFPIIVGRHVGLDGVVRDLRLSMCSDCEAVEVRDITHDRDTDHDPLGRGFARRSRLPWRRRAHIIGWYTGSRPRQRTYGRAT